MGNFETYPLALSENENFETLIKVHQMNIFANPHLWWPRLSWQQFMIFSESPSFQQRDCRLYIVALWKGKTPTFQKGVKMISRNHYKWNPLSFNSLPRTHKPAPERLHGQQTFIFKGGGLRLQVFNDCILTHGAKKAFWTMMPGSLHEPWPYVHRYVQLGCLCKTICLFKLATHMDSTSYHKTYNLFYQLYSNHGLDKI